ncbi:MAG TPA: ribosomal protein L7/L12 [Candidatus Obscuribacterales bacterium]
MSPELVAMIAFATFVAGFVVGKATSSDNTLRLRDQGNLMPLQPLPEDIEQRIRMLVDRREKIMAIKEVRQHTGCGLKQAKDIVEGMEKGRSFKELTDRDMPPR